jgi:hypothetical protein
MPGQPINTQQRVFGHAGGSLVGASWAANDAVARVGRRAELQSAVVLDRLASRPDGPTVLHDLAIPIPGISANIDHVVVSGQRVLIIDSKGWKPARYWSVGGATFRGFRRFEHAKTRTLGMAHQALTGYLRGRGCPRRTGDADRGGVAVDRRHADLADLLPGLPPNVSTEWTTPFPESLQAFARKMVDLPCQQPSSMMSPGVPA